MIYFFMWKTIILRQLLYTYNIHNKALSAKFEFSERIKVQTGIRDNVYFYFVIIKIYTVSWANKRIVITVTKYLPR